MASIPLHKGTLAFDVHGPEGAPWALILPGAFTAPWQYHPLRDALARDFRVITLDYRGIGQSRNDLWTVTPTQLGEDVRALLDHLAVERTHAVCVSMGSFVLSELLHAKRDRIARCCVAAMPALRGSMRFGSGHEVLRMRRDEQPMKQVLASLFPMFVSERFQREQPERFREMMDRVGELRPDQVWAGLQQFYGVFGHDWNRTRVLGELQGQALFLTGDADPFAPLHDAREHPVLRRGPTVVFRGAGHLFFYEQAETFHRIVGSFLATGRLPDPLPGAPDVQRLGQEVAR